ncbi:unnamed protein product [Hymenolepis diminuta]|uniref:EGF-like domain-containing protein n=1 Tax=Hymenolepis diminuta TaxID=6216 RepID=A0A0R3S9S0_HYMDI|nr:unnamed protein product [Hymenolepis diminuta]
MDFWGYTGLDDLKDRELVLKRRTIVIACLHWCHGMLALPENERPMMKYLCPNPCKQPGLCMGAADERGSCHLTGDGFFHHQYACNCKPGGLWNAEIGACTNDEDPCKNKKSPPCFPEGTELCSFDRESGGVTCLCKPHYMGDNCSIPANACDDHIRNPLLPNGGLSAIGNRACNINNDGNRCIASLDPNLGPIYSCICTEEHWTGDLTLSYDNCLKKVTNCDKIICINGECVDSKDGKEASQEIAVCVCNEGYEGSPSCATFTGIWSSWSPWGQCLPACGSERWALRSRKCLSMETEHSGCRGPTIEFTPCDPHVCAVEEGIMMSQYFGAREVTLQAVFVIAAVSAVGLTLFWRYKLYPNLAIRIRQNLQKPQRKDE